MLIRQLGRLINIYFFFFVYFVNLPNGKMRALSHPLIFQRNLRGLDKILKLIDIQVESGIFSWL